MVSDRKDAKQRNISLRKTQKTACGTLYSRTTRKQGNQTTTNSQKLEKEKNYMTQPHLRQTTQVARTMPSPYPRFDRKWNPTLGYTYRDGTRTGFPTLGEYVVTVIGLGRGG